MRDPNTMHSSKGFSLIELAIVLVIIGLLIGGGVVALERTTERDNRQQQQRHLQEMREALYGFAVSRGRLPCPDTTDPPNGLEGSGSESDNVCAQDPVAEPRAFGVLPWAELGINGRDAWGDRMLYAVSTAYADTVTDLTIEGALDVEDANADGTLLARDVPVVVVAFGGQGQQVWANGLPCDSGLQGFSDDEIQNCNETRTFAGGTYRGPDAPDGRFDDMVVWLADGVFKIRMIEAGHLP